MPAGIPLPVTANREIRYWLLQGKKPADVARRVGVSRAIVYRRWNVLLETGEIPLCRCGRPEAHRGPCVARDPDWEIKQARDEVEACRDLWFAVLRANIEDPEWITTDDFEAVCWYANVRPQVVRRYL